MSQKKPFAWAVVGAGPAGIAAVGLLLDAGISGKDILWIDPYFQVGDFGRHWGEVNSNTRVALFHKFLHEVDSFDYKKKSCDFAFDALDHNHFTQLKNVTDPLQFITNHLQKKVAAQKTIVTELSIDAGCWQLHTEKNYFCAEKVILATGAEPKSLHYKNPEEIKLEIALTPSELKKICNENDVVAIFGSSHSAMIAIRNLIEAGVKKVVNFYQSPLRYAVLMDDWILYDDTGLKGETAEWVRENISKKCLPQISRHQSTEKNIDQFLPQCTKAIYAIGFCPRHISIADISLHDYDQSNGIIAPGLFGLGIGFPIIVTDPFGHQEANVGLWKFLKNMRRTLPIWQRYAL